MAGQGRLGPSALSCPPHAVRTNWGKAELVKTQAIAVGCSFI